MPAAFIQHFQVPTAQREDSGPKTKTLTREESDQDRASLAALGTGTVTDTREERDQDYATAGPEKTATREGPDQIAASGSFAAIRAIGTSTKTREERDQRAAVPTGTRTREERDQRYASAGPTITESKEGRQQLALSAPLAAVQG